MKTALRVITVLMLIGLAIYQGTQIAQAMKSYRRRSESTEKLKHYMQQQVALCEAALAPEADWTVSESLPEALTRIQNKYGAFPPESSDEIQIVSVPEPMLAERQAFTWKISVPEGQVLELIAFNGGEAAQVSDAKEVYLRQRIPSGRSVVSIDFRGQYQATWGNTLPVEERVEKWRTFIRFRLNDSELWQKEWISDLGIYHRESVFAEPTVISPGSEEVELLYKIGLHLVLAEPDNGGVADE